MSKRLSNVSDTLPEPATDDRARVTEAAACLEESKDAPLVEHPAVKLNVALEKSTAEEDTLSSTPSATATAARNNNDSGSKGDGSAADHAPGQQPSAASLDQIDQIKLV